MLRPLIDWRLARRPLGCGGNAAPLLRRQGHFGAPGAPVEDQRLEAKGRFSPPVSMSISLAARTRLASQTCANAGRDS